MDLGADLNLSKEQKNFFWVMEQVEKLEERVKAQGDFMSFLSKEQQRMKLESAM